MTTYYKPMYPSPLNGPFSQEMITAILDALRPLASPGDDNEDAQQYNVWCETQFDSKTVQDRTQIVDHLLGIASYAASLARDLIHRESE